MFWNLSNRKIGKVEIACQEVRLSPQNNLIVCASSIKICGVVKRCLDDLYHEAATKNALQNPRNAAAQQWTLPTVGCNKEIYNQETYLSKQIVPQQ